MNTENLITKLGLHPHPEGGYYKETYRAADIIRTSTNKPRNISTSIFYLLQDNDRSCFHRILSDEHWFFHQGQALEIFSIQNGALRIQQLGNDLENGESPQVMIPADTWFAARLKSTPGYSLVSCMVAPGFDFADFELAKRSELIGQYPHLKEIIENLTH